MISDETMKLLDSQDWEFIIKAATVHAIYQFKLKNLLNPSGLNGYTPEEIVMESIEKIYLGEWNWNPKKSDLLPYLKYHVIKGLISNLIRSEAFKKGSNQELSALEIENSDIDVIEEMSASQIITYINQNIDDEDGIIVFNQLSQGLKRKEIIEDLSWGKDRFDNAMKRLKTQLKKLELRELINQ